MREARFYMLVKSLCLLLLLAMCAGCTQKILVLKRFASSQKEMQSYVAKQEKGFLRLTKDIQRASLRKGISKESVIKKYGEPVFCDTATPCLIGQASVLPPAAEGGIAQSCLYRDPTEYFSTDKVYLYFDRQDRLHSWKYEPAE